MCHTQSNHLIILPVYDLASDTHQGIFEAFGDAWKNIILKKESQTFLIYLNCSFIN